MSMLIELRKDFEAVQSVLSGLQIRRERFTKASWLSTTAWQRMGYAVRTGETSDVILGFQTPRGWQSYVAYHAGQVEVRPAVWQKMIRHCNRQSQSLDRLRQSDRVSVCASLLDVGENRLARRLVPALVTDQKFQEGRDYLTDLDRRIQQAFDHHAAAKLAYEEALAPIVSKRRATMKRRKLLHSLGELGVTDDKLSSEASISDLEGLLHRTRFEAQRRDALEELGQLGVDVTTLAPALSVETLYSLLQRRRRQTDPLRVSRVLRMNGIDPDTVLVGVDPREVLDLFEVDGYLATVPSGLTTSERLHDLERRGKALAAWACEQYPSYVVEEPCFRNPIRSKLIFRMPPRQQRDNDRPRRRSRRIEEAAWLLTNIPWQQAGF